MPQGIDPEWLGEHLRQTRKERGLTLQDVATQTGITVATLSRIERAAFQDVKSETLVQLAGWMRTTVERLQGHPPKVMHRGKEVRSTPEIVELHLRADKKLNPKTSKALANLFRTAYEHFTGQLTEE